MTQETDRIRSGNQHITQFWLPRTILSIAIGYLQIRATLEFQRAIPHLEEISPSRNWDAVLIALIAINLVVFLGIMAYLWFPENTKSFWGKAILWRERLHWLTWPLALVIAAAPVYLHLYSPLRYVFGGPYTRLLTISLAGLLVAILTTSSTERLLSRQNLFFGFLLAGGLFYIGYEISTITNHPFSMTWGEGNRLYDYSLFLGKKRYINGQEIEGIDGEFGRYFLWGFLFYLKSTPIWLHRAWNAALATVPYLLLGYFLARWSKFEATGKWGFVFWVLLFLLQAPVYAPLILSALAVVIFVRRKQLLLSLIITAIAGYYAASSRWTWLLAPAAWAVAILISELELRKGDQWRSVLSRLVPIGIVGLAGLVGGLLANAKFFQPQTLGESTFLSQPLLWYRLLPNPTYREGILIGLLVAAGPLIALMIWMWLSRRWDLNWLQILVYGGTLLGFLIMGLVASTKIGGGNNLHNLDMFFVTLAILCGLMLQGRPRLVQPNWPLLAQGLLILTVFLPVWNISSKGAPLQLPSANETREALRVVEKRVNQALEHGEVLFIHERQLLTFGYLEGVPLIPEYEERDLMDQAMADNAEYFKQFYDDLANKRFGLIITEPLYGREKGQAEKFGEENDAWIKWVSQPVLCYYKPVRLLHSVNVEFLEPRDEPKDCPDIAIVEE